MTQRPKGCNNNRTFSQTPTLLLVSLPAQQNFFVQTEKGVAWIHMGAAPLLSLAYDPASSNPDEATPERRFGYHHNKSLRVSTKIAVTYIYTRRQVYYQIKQFPRSLWICFASPQLIALVVCHRVDLLVFGDFLKTSLKGIVTRC